MGKIAFVFSGQGDQYPGMGRELYETVPSARNIFLQLDRIRPGTSGQCFSGSETELKETRNTQPCLFAMELAAAAALKEYGIQPDAVAGFSLGEMTAASVSGLLAADDAFRLVCIRGELMQTESEKYETSMAAVLKLSADKVRNLCDHYPDLYPVNYNCPGQITVSGLSSQITAFSADVKAAGGRAVPLKVTGAFHSPFMQEAANRFLNELSKSKLDVQEIPLYSNMTAEPYPGRRSGQTQEDGDITDSAAELLSGQICHPVQWEQSIRNMINTGIDTFIEIGPGRTLTNLIRKISPEVKAMTYTECL